MTKGSFHYPPPKSDLARFGENVRRQIPVVQDDLFADLLDKLDQIPFVDDSPLSDGQPLLKR